MNKLIMAFTILIMSAQAIAAELGVSHAWVRASVPGQTVASAFVTLSNPLEKPLKFKEIHSKVARTVELHSHAMVDGQMRMRKLEEFMIPANGEARFVPGENHIMLIGLEHPLQENTTVTLEMCFDELCSIITLPVISIDNEPAPEKAH